MSLSLGCQGLKVERNKLVCTACICIIIIIDVYSLFMSIQHCEVEIGKRRIKALVDTEASVSLTNARIYRKLGFKKLLRKPDLAICQGDGCEIKVHGIVIYL